MDLQRIVSFSRRRRLVDLRFHPGLQLQLPVLLLGITAAFALLFLTHTRAAYGMLLEAGLAEPWLRTLAEEIRHDFLVVSLAIAIAYVVLVLGACLASTHRVLGPIVALQRHMDRLKKGDYTARIRVRAGHPLGALAEDLNELSALLDRAGPTASVDRPIAAPRMQLTDQATRAVDRLLRVYTPENRVEGTRELHRASAAG